MNTKKSKVYTVARLLLGTLFFVFGLNGFFQFLPQPPHVGQSADFLGALVASGYMFPLIKGTEVATGVFLLAGRYVPLALTVLAPVVVNILAFHLFLDPAGIALPLVILALGLYLAWSERDAYAPLFKARVKEAPQPAARVGGHATSAA